MSNPDSIVVFLDTLKLKDEYLQRFKDTGFDDLNLLKSLSEDERQDMFNLVGLSNKPGHLLKFKKALVAACENQIRDQQHQVVRNPNQRKSKKVSAYNCCSCIQSCVLVCINMNI